IPSFDPSFPEFLAPGEAIFANAAVPTELQAPDPTLRIRYYHLDHLSSATAITDAAGDLREETAFFPFGMARVEYNVRQGGEPYKFTQKEKDKESSLHYFGARFYAAGINRWLSCDPAERSGLSPYQYAKNDPTQFTDPNGLDDKSAYIENCKFLQER